MHDQDGVLTEEDTPIVISLSASDVDGDALEVDLLSNPVNGILSSTGLSLVDEDAILWGALVDIYEREDGRLLAYRVEPQIGPGGDLDHSLRSPVVRNVYPNMADAIVNPNLGLYTACLLYTSPSPRD